MPTSRHRACPRGSSQSEHHSATSFSRLAHRTGCAGCRRVREYRELMTNLRHVNAGRKFTRDEMNERPRFFLDTNIFVYSFDCKPTGRPACRRPWLRAALASGLGIISYQVVQEFVSAARKPFQNPMTFADIERYCAHHLATDDGGTFLPGAIHSEALRPCPARPALLVRLAHRGRCRPGRLQGSLQRRLAAWPSLRRPGHSEPVSLSVHERHPACRSVLRHCCRI